MPFLLYSWISPRTAHWSRSCFTCSEVLSSSYGNINALRNLGDAFSLPSSSALLKIPINSKRPASGKLATFSFRHISPVIIRRGIHSPYWDSGSTYHKATRLLAPTYFAATTSRWSGRCSRSGLVFVVFWWSLRYGSFFNSFLAIDNASNNLGQSPSATSRYSYLANIILIGFWHTVS